jgi:transposase-like protein
MGRATSYSDEDRARLFVALSVHKGNVKRVTRETGIPESTVRRLKKEFETNPPPSALVENYSDAFVNEASVVRDMALYEMRKKIPDAKLGELNAVVGTLTDKINTAKGLANTRVEHTHTLPTREELAAVLGPAVQDAIEAAKARQQDLVELEAEDAELVALPPSNQ